MVFENEVALLFSSVSLEKLQEKSLQLTIHGKDQAKKTIHLGQIGKIHFNQLKPFEIDNRVDFLQEVEKIKQVNSSTAPISSNNIFSRFSHQSNSMFRLKNVTNNSFTLICNVSKD